MNSYFEIKLLPDSEFPATVLMNAIYTKLHKALFDLSENGVGVSFPKANNTLGTIIRLSGEKSSLEKLLNSKWLGGMSGYCKLSELLQVPPNTKHRTISRVQPNMSESKLKRLLKRGSITEEEAKAYRAKMFTKGLDNPYIELVSASNGQRHRRYLEFGELQNEPVAGEFDTFGLSKTATVPWF